MLTKKIAPGRGCIDRLPPKFIGSCWFTLQADQEIINSEPCGGARFFDILRAIEPSVGLARDQSNERSRLFARLLVSFG